jgi:hypothetical protein
MLAVGRSAKDLGGITPLTNKQIADGTAKVKALGVEVGEGGTAAQAYKAAMAEVNDTMGALKIRVGQELMPAVAQLAQTFFGTANAVAPALAACFKGLAAVTDHWKTAVALLAVALSQKLKAVLTELFMTTIPKLIAQVKAFIASLGPIGIAMAAVAAAVVAWDQLAGSAKRAAKAAAEYAAEKARAFAAGGSRLRELVQQLRELDAQFGKKGADVGALLERRALLIKEMQSLGGAAYLYAGAIAEGPLKNAEHFIGVMLAKHKELTAASLASAEAELAAMTQASACYAEKLEEVATLRREMIALTGDSVKAAGAFVAPDTHGKKEEKEKPAPMIAWNPKALEAAVKAQDAADAADAAREKARRERAKELALAMLAEERALADHKVAMGQMTAERRLEIERGFVAREREIIAQAGEANSVTIQESLNALREAQRRLLEEQTRAWRELGESIKSSMQDALIGLVNGTQSWGDATRAVMNSVLQGLLQKAAAAAAQELTLERMKLAAKKLLVGEEVAAKTAGATAGAAVTVAAAAPEIGAQAAVAGAGAAASQAGIPVIGPALGMAAMAAMVAGVMALMGNLKSAAGGYWQVPSDMLANIHKDEMVLPARHSARLRDMLEGGGEGFGAPGGSPPVTVNISAVDARGVARLFRANGGGLADALRARARDFAFMG